MNKLDDYIKLAESATEGPWKTADEIDGSDMPYLFGPSAESTLGPVIARFDYSRKDRDFIQQSRLLGPAMAKALIEAEEALKMDYEWNWLETDAEGGMNVTDEMRGFVKKRKQALATIKKLKENEK